jgi:DNA (cytosine-5)-methyltransferase 1
LINEWTHLSLFSGIGAIDLAFEWAGFKTVGQVELADWPYLKLTEIWPDVPKWRNVKRVTKKSLVRAGIKSQITVLSGGFPCQPFSTSGKRQGKEDDRHLWPEMFRLVRECRPAWVLGENVTGIIGMELDNALADLESAGYTCRAFNIPAVAVGAWHERKRVFIVATNTGYDPADGSQGRDPLGNL